MSVSGDFPCPPPGRSRDRLRGECRVPAHQPDREVLRLQQPLTHGGPLHHISRDRGTLLHHTMRLSHKVIALRSNSPD